MTPGQIGVTLLLWKTPSSGRPHLGALPTVSPVPLEELGVLSLQEPQPHFFFPLSLPPHHF